VHPISTLPQDLFVCPRCRQALAASGRCSCGFAVCESNGVINFMTDEEVAALRPFLDAYERVRRDEGWGGDDLDLPFRAKRHHDIWNIRQRTFRKFESLATKIGRGTALDIGAGNCWMTRYMAQWGFEAIAMDVNVSPSDGLQAGQKFINEGANFLRVRAGMERLPFASGRIRLLASNASFHYARDFRAALLEFERVLTPGGMIAIIDTPFYENAADGERMMAERVAEFRQKYRMEEAQARKSRYMTFRQLEELAGSLNLRRHVYPVWPGLRRRYEEIRAIFLRRQIARFPVVVLEKS
jgi:ubiquinone/menaquinone biosynthesis C-methylase UbiE